MVLYMVPGSSKTDLIYCRDDLRSLQKFLKVLDAEIADTDAPECPMDEEIH